MKLDNDLRVRPDQQQLLKKSILWNIVEPGDPYDIKKYFSQLWQIDHCSAPWR